jgi:hypothetical protein
MSKRFRGSPIPIIIDIYNVWPITQLFTADLKVIGEHEFLDVDYLLRKIKVNQGRIESLENETHDIFTNKYITDKEHAKQEYKEEYIKRIKNARSNICNLLFSAN